jgi:hypothetical protein
MTHHTPEYHLRRLISGSILDIAFQTEELEGRESAVALIAHCIEAGINPRNRIRDNAERTKRIIRHGLQSFEALAGVQPTHAILARVCLLWLFNTVHDLFLVDDFVNTESGVPENQLKLDASTKVFLCHKLLELCYQKTIPGAVPQNEVSPLTWFFDPRRPSQPMPEMLELLEQTSAHVGKLRGNSEFFHREIGEQKVAVQRSRHQAALDARKALDRRETQWRSTMSSKLMGEAEVMYTKFRNNHEARYEILPIDPEEEAAGTNDGRPTDVYDLLMESVDDSDAVETPLLSEKSERVSFNLAPTEILAKPQSAAEPACALEPVQFPISVKTEVVTMVLNGLTCEVPAPIAKSLERQMKLDATRDWKLMLLNGIQCLLPAADAAKLEKILTDAFVTQQFDHEEELATA